MALPAQFQVGVELTNIFNPINQAVSALGSFVLVDAIKKAGSDAMTEVKLASLIGRHKIDPIIDVHFRHAVAKTDHSLLSRFTDIVLESGAGPTVQEALRNPALFSMVIQLSGLTFAHEAQSLANAFVEAVERNVQEAHGNEQLVPDYVSLLGTLKACQQQTAAFRWAPLFESVERKFEGALKASKTRSVSKAGMKRKRPRLNESDTRNCSRARSLPFPILQGILKWLQSLQSFPEESLLHLKCNSGISTVVVWCHHILGMSLTIRCSDVDVQFGKSPGNILVEACSVEQTKASLMDPQIQYEPLFTLLNDDANHSISSERRAECYGFGQALLRSRHVSEDRLRIYSTWTTAACLQLIHHKCRPNFDLKPCRDEVHYNMLPSDIGCGYCFIDPKLNSHLSEERVIGAAKYMFKLEHVEIMEAQKIVFSSEWPCEKVRLQVGDQLRHLMNILIAFALISEEDLQNCTKMPLTLHASTVLDQHMHSSGDNPLDLFKAFDILGMLLMGNSFSEEHVSSAVLISAWGWSIFFDSVNAVDPQDVSVDILRVVCGVPARRGLRRSLVTDGPNSLLISNSTGVKILESPEIHFFPGVSTAVRGATLVGVNADAFQINQIFNWTSRETKSESNQTHKLGFREMQELCLQVEWINATCNCDLKSSEILSCDCNTASRPFTSLPMLESRLDSHGDNAVNMQDRHQGHRHCETVLAFNTFSRSLLHAFEVSSKPAARWLQLDDLCNSCEKNAFRRVVRRRNTCMRCTLRESIITGKALKKDTLLLL